MVVTSVRNSPPQHSPINRVLIVGNYCHDVLIQDGSAVAETLGGAVAFIANVLNGLSVSSSLTSKVGKDFKYAVNNVPIVIPTSRTTVFEAYFDLGLVGNGHQDRVLKRVCACDPIAPVDLPEGRFDFGMAVGVGGEILPETLERMVEICDVVFVDIQALIRVFDEDDGTVKLLGLKESGFYHLLPRIGFLKASSDEALFLNVEEVRRLCCVVVTNGKEGCKLFSKDGELQIAPFEANQVDPTGAGDSFLGGFVAGLVQGLAVPDAALLGNLFGSLTVEQIGLPKFDFKFFQMIKDEVQRRKAQCICFGERRYDELKLKELVGHEQFHTSLGAAKLKSSCSDQDCQWDTPPSSKAVEQGTLPQFIGQPKRLINPVYEEPIRTVDGKQ
ncbi:inositol 3-kinase isoform X2 [Carica papaya]|uniref:inositol 3-kinase isoform X2 n=1 Tax=Carica papaya TaxID=3649 RepID=UPI000B8D12C1|nr:inositol 3-kinase isoform X2 [Carica papaya]